MIKSQKTNQNMGCVFTHREPPCATPSDIPEQRPPKPARKFSWDKREKVIIKDFTIEDLKEETVCKLPGSVDGQQFGIENCEDSNIYIFDYSSAVAIENCTNCRIFVGPVKSSVYVRGCSECTIGVACQQLKVRGCRKLDISLCSASGPILESSASINLSCLQYYYPALIDQFHTAQLSVYNNNWGRVTDNSSKRSANNYHIASENVRIDSLIPQNTEASGSMDVSSSPERSEIPFTPGIRKAPKDKSCLVIFFSDGLSHERAHTFIKRMTELHTECSLVQSREIYMQEEDAETVFGTDSYAMAVKQGPVIGLEYSGPQCCHVCQDTLIAVSKGSTGLVFVSGNSESAPRQVEYFFRIAEHNSSCFTPQRVGSVKR